MTESQREHDRLERDPARVAAFSDAVLAIAVTLLVLEIKPPDDTGHLLHGLAALWPSYLAYVITFMLIVGSWARRCDACERDRDDRWLNVRGGASSRLGVGLGRSIFVETNGADVNAASAERSSDMRSGVRAPSSANAGKVEPWIVDRVQTGTIVLSTSLMHLLGQGPRLSPRFRCRGRRRSRSPSRILTPCVQPSAIKRTRRSATDRRASTCPTSSRCLSPPACESANCSPSDGPTSS